MLQEALELEVQQYIERFQQLKSESGQGLVVRNGYHQERELVTGAGKVVSRWIAGSRIRSPPFAYAAQNRAVARTSITGAMMPASGRPTHDLHRTATGCTCSPESLNTCHHGMNHRRSGAASPNRAHGVRKSPTPPLSRSRSPKQRSLNAGNGAL